MTENTLRFLAQGRAIWPACLAFVLIGGLAGCGDAVDPVAPAEPSAGGDAGFVAYLDPVDLDSDAALAVTAPGHGRWTLTNDSEPVIVDVLPGEPIQFFWRATDGVGLDNRATYRYGWNVTDPDDLQDPGWFGPPNSGFKMQQTEPREVSQGAESLTIERWDGGRLLVRVTIEVWSMPVDP